MLSQSKTQRKDELRAFLLIILFLAGRASSLGSQEEVPPGELTNMKSPGFRLESAPTSLALTEALNPLHLPGGIVSPRDCSDWPKHSFFVPPGSSLGSALDRISETDPRYKWRIDGGVVNLIPSAGIPPLLNTEISHFKIANVSTPELAIGLLLSSPEVRQGASALKLEEGYTRFGMYAIPRPGNEKSWPRTKLSLDLKGVTLVQALNAIVRAHGRAVWDYEELHCGDKHLYSVNLVLR